MKDNLATTTLVLTNPVLKTRSFKLSGFILPRRIIVRLQYRLSLIFPYMYADFKVLLNIYILRKGGQLNIKGILILGILKLHTIITLLCSKMLKNTIIVRHMSLVEFVFLGTWYNWLYTCVSLCFSALNIISMHLHNFEKRNVSTFSSIICNVLSKYSAINSHRSHRIYTLQKTMKRY